MTQHFLQAISLLLAFSLATSAFGQSSLKVKNAVYSAKVVSLTTGKTLFSENEDKTLTPASVTKTILAAAALEEFGPAHQFTTKVLHTGKRIHSKIKGDLIVVGAGDPFLISEKLWQLVADIRNLGIDEISGDLVIDNSLFDNEWRDQSRKGAKTASRNAYDAPVSALGVNFNTFAIFIGPGSSTGKPAIITLDPYNINDIEITNTTKTTSGSEFSIKVNRKTTNGKTVLNASGQIGKSQGIHKIYRSISNSQTTPGKIVKAFLENNQIRVQGNVVNKPLPKNARFLTEVAGYPIREIVRGLNTFSNNYIADMLTKGLAKRAHPNSPGDLDAGSKFLKDYMKKRSKTGASLIINNGSGLDTENKISARHLVDLLSYMYNASSVFPEFYASLPAAGWDGTMKNRFSRSKQKRLHGLIRAKTGTLTSPISVASLSGYLKHPKEGIVAFAILHNGIEGRSQPSISALRDQQDQFLTSLITP